MLDEMRRVVRWPLRSVGLDAGRALTNAQPTPDAWQAQRLEQWAHIRARFDPSGTTSLPSAG